VESSCCVLWPGTMGLPRKRRLNLSPPFVLLPDSNHDPQQVEEIAQEPNRAIVAARNAEIRCVLDSERQAGLHHLAYVPSAAQRDCCRQTPRKTKQQLLTEGIDGLQKKLKKGKGVTKVLVEERQRRVSGATG
jgi:hypothetical protein